MALSSCTIFEGENWKQLTIVVMRLENKFELWTQPLANANQDTKNKPTIGLTLIVYHS